MSYRNWPTFPKYFARFLMILVHLRRSVYSVYFWGFCSFQFFIMPILCAITKDSKDISEATCGKSRSTVVQKFPNFSRKTHHLNDCVTVRDYVRTQIDEHQVPLKQCCSLSFILPTLWHKAYSVALFLPSPYRQYGGCSREGR